MNRNASDVEVHFETSVGSFVICVHARAAPITSANFLRYVDTSLYVGGAFHRACRRDNYIPQLPDRPLLESIQAGIDPQRIEAAFPPIELEHTQATGLRHVRGTVAMGRNGPTSARFSFFVLLNDQPSLDFGGRRYTDALGTAAFGTVTSGFDTLQRIQQQPANGQLLAPPIPIVRATRIGR
jgi:peptidyl-prolyl cis-trans isomerase A (cyclophilin A)